MQSALYPGRVMHVRQQPVRHRFAYTTTAIYLDLAELPELDRRLRLFGVNRRGVVSFRDADHGPRTGDALRPWIDGALAEAGIDLEGGPVRLLCMPRVLGYVFNPLTVWYCYHRTEGLTAILYEVSNTFGQHHCYLIPVAGARGRSGVIRQSCAKAFYVSPFMPVSGDYAFRLREPGERLSLAISYTAGDGSAMSAVQTGARRPLTDANLLRMLVRQPALTHKVIGAIHWEALHLWRKGARYHRRPSPPPHLVSTQPHAQEAAE